MDIIIYLTLGSLLYYFGMILWFITGNLFSESAVVDDYGSYRITNNSDTKCPCVACNMEESS